MNYDEIRTAAYGYADRTDVETLDRYNDFLVILESKINRYIKTLNMSTRVTLDSVDDQTYYGLPPDFRGMRNMQITGNGVNGVSRTVTAKFSSPAKINESRNITPLARGDEILYTIINNQFQIEPQLSNQSIELVYYRKVPPLTAINTTNWLSDEHPDAYIFGVMVEISSFNKNPESAALWTDRYITALNEIKEDDVDIRWSGGDVLVMSTL